MSFTRFAVRFAIVCGAGAASVLILPPFSMLILTPLVWSALLICLSGTPAGSAAILGFAFGLFQFGFGLSWITESFYIEADRFGALAIPSVTGLSAFLAIFPAFASAVFARSSRCANPGVPAAFILACALTGGEWLRGHLLTGFPWNLAGYAVADFDGLRQPAAWVGSYGMSFLVVFIGALPGAAWVAKGRQRHSAMAAALLLPLAIWTAGTLRLTQTESTPTGIFLRVVQGNFPQTEKWGHDARKRALDRYASMSSEGPPVDVVLWPETAFPGYLDEDSAARELISAALPKDALLMTGVPSRHRTIDSTSYFNAVQVYNSLGKLLDSYTKHHLVPFGEYQPLPSWLPLDRIVDATGDFTPGPGPRTLVLPNIPLVAPAICFEIIFPGHVVDPGLRPSWIFNATNDAWFGMSIGPKQHLASAQMRSVEEGLPIVRAANTGISAVIDANGRIRQRLDTGITGTLESELPPALPITLYAQFGDWMLVVVTMLFSAPALLARLVQRE